MIAKGSCPTRSALPARSRPCAPCSPSPGSWARGCCSWRPSRRVDRHHRRDDRRAWSTPTRRRAAGIVTGRRSILLALLALGLLARVAARGADRRWPGWPSSASPRWRSPGPRTARTCTTPARSGDVYAEATADAGAGLLPRDARRGAAARERRGAAACSGAGGEAAARRARGRRRSAAAARTQVRRGGAGDWRRRAGGGVSALSAGAGGGAARLARSWSGAPPSASATRASSGWRRGALS